MEVKISPPFVIYAEETPNPSVMKFVSDRVLLPEGKIFEFTRVPENVQFPLGSELIRFPFIEKVHISGNFISIHKKDFAGWADIYMEVRNFISEFLNTKGFYFLIPEEETVWKSSEENISGAENYRVGHSSPQSEVEKKIIEILDNYIRPGVEMDGGFIAFRGLKDKKLKVELRGSCRGCPSSVATLKNGIEQMMKRLLPGAVEEVVNADQEDV